MFWDHLIQSIQTVLKSCDHLRKPQYRGNSNPLTGHCYVASEVFYHLMGGKESGFVPMYIKHESSPHWFLRHKSTGTVVDVTADQFCTPVPHDSGVGKGFLTKEPSKRAKEIIGRLV